MSRTNEREPTQASLGASFQFAATSWLPRLKEAGFELVCQWLVPEDRWSILDLNTGKMRWQAQHDHGFLLRRGHDISIDQPLVTF